MKVRLLQELLARERPYAKCRLDVQVIRAIYNGELPEFGIGLKGYHDKLLKTICTQCWNSGPEDRITIRNVLRMLEGSIYENDRVSSPRSRKERGE